MQTSIHIDNAVRIEMRDGIRLDASVYRPADAERHPAILLRSYDARRLANRVPLVTDLIDAGYAFVSSNIRGRLGSEGEWKPGNYLEGEGCDGYDTVEWIVQQPWCDGSVGIFGASHMAEFAVYAAVQQPPHLKAIAPWTGGFGHAGGFRPPRTGGVISYLPTLLWLPNKVSEVVDRLERQGEDVSEMRRELERVRSHPEETYNFLPLNDLPITRYGPLREMWQWRLQFGALPDTGNRDLYERVTVPCFHECGWYDGVAWTEFENFNGMREFGASEQARAGQYIIAGPWPHGVRFDPILGDLSFGNAASTDGAGIHAYQIAFFDKYMRGRDITLPHVRYFVMGKNEWRQADAWPLPETDWQRMFLHSGGSANTSAGNGGLSREQPGSEPPDLFIYNPHRPVPTLGGPLIGYADAPGMVVGPIEQSPVERRDDVLCYTTPELKQPLLVTGPLQCHLFVSTSCRDTDWTVKLIDVYPNGRAYNLAEGILRMSGRSFTGAREPVVPGQVYEVVVTLGQTSQLFRPGHHIRLDVSSSNFPQFDRNLNTGNPTGVDAQGIAALNTIYHRADCASYIDLPVIPDAA